MRIRFGGGVVLTLFLLSGCGGGGPDTNVRMAESARPDVDDVALASGHRSIPADAPFNITKFSSGQNGEKAAGQSGRIDGSGGSCGSSVEGEGTAWGAFQLGYAFDNSTSKPIQAVIHLKLQSAATGEFQASPKDVYDIPTGAATLTFVLKDTLGVVLKQESLFTGDLANGAADAKRNHDLTFDAKLQPGRGFYLLVSGKVEATCKADQRAKLGLAASGMEINIDWKSAESVARAPESDGAAGAASER